MFNKFKKRIYKTGVSISDPEPDTNILITATPVGEEDDPAITDITYEYIGFTPTTARMYIFSYDTDAGIAVGSPLYSNLSLNTTSGVHAINDINLPNVAIYGTNYIIEIETDIPPIYYFVIPQIPA